MSTTRCLVGRLAFAGLLVVSAVVAAIVVGQQISGDEPKQGPLVLLQPGNARLTSAEDGKVALVQFIDFGCEQCREAQEAVDELRNAYAGRITFAVRNFPQQRNSEAAARAAEAAGAQGKYEAMLHRLLDDQSAWKDHQGIEPTFLEFADQLGLRVSKFHADYNDPAVISRIRRDKQDGITAGVTSVPAFFLNGQRLSVARVAEMEDPIDDALR